MEKSIHELWKPIPGYGGKYEASDQGRIRSFARPSAPGYVLKPVIARGGYPRVSLAGRNYSVHRLVALAFHPNPHGHPLVRHLDDVPTHNAASNLAWGTYSDNGKDVVILGNHPKSNTAHCPSGHAYEGENLMLRSDGSRKCRECIRALKKAPTACEVCGATVASRNLRRHQASIECKTPEAEARRDSLAPRTQCVRGHEYTPENTILRRKQNRPNPARVCRECEEERSRNRRRNPLASVGLTPTNPEPMEAP